MTDASGSQPVQLKPKDTGFFDSYGSFSRTLRTWLVAYGIGAPVLFASQTTFARILAKPGIAIPVIVPFLAGVGLQVVAAFIYKYAMGYLYFGEEDPKFQKTIRHKVSDWISEAMWLEMVFDLLTLAAFAWATAKVLLMYVALGGASTSS